MTAPESKTLSKLKGLGIYQIIGGSIGTLLTLWGLLSSSEITGMIVLLYLCMTLIFLFSIYCGILCVRRMNDALTLSLVNQVLQVIGFSIFGVTFQYAAGVYLTIGLDLTDSLVFKFEAGISKLDFRVGSAYEELVVHFNFVALGLILFIDKLKSQIKRDSEAEKISIIGSS